MAPSRTYRRRWILIPAVVASLSVQAAALATYQLATPTPDPTLTIRLVGEGQGTVLVTKVGDPQPLLRCAAKASGDAHCRVHLPEGTQVRLTAVLDEDATFGGYQQLPIRTPKELVPYLGDPLAKCIDIDPTALARGEVMDVMDCTVTLAASTEVGAEFGLQPKEIDVALENPLDGLITPASPPEKRAPTPITPETLDRPMEVAIAPPLLKPPPMIQPPPPPQELPTPPKPQQPPMNQVMVEVKDDKHVVAKAPEDADKLSDKNRDVDEETRAKETNLEKESEGQQVASVESEVKSSEIGGPDDKIRQLEQTEATTDKRIDQTDHSGDNATAKGEIKGEGGDNGDNGTGENQPGVLSMRGIEGRGSLQDQGHDGKKAGRKGTIGVTTPLSFQDYERILGKDKADEERQVAARKMSAKKGRWEKKLDAIKSSLENFVPDVRTGNQTALKTRAHPFALYVARMHRRIHELWGFGYLDSLDDKSASDPLNNLELWVNLEISVNQDGTVHKVTIAKTSGKTEFDVAAIDTVLTSAPYEETPEQIRSSDGRVYLRWGFYRNWRQCGTFNVEPYILTDIPSDSGTGVLDDGQMVRNTGKLAGKAKKPEVAANSDKPVTPDDGKSKDRATPTTTVMDKEALFSANLWVAAFTQGATDKLVKYSTVPFYAAGRVAAETTADLKDMYTGLVVESGPMKDWKLLTATEYQGASALPEGNVVLQIRTTKETFAIVLTKTKSGDYRATQLAR